MAQQDSRKKHADAGQLQALIADVYIGAVIARVEDIPGVLTVWAIVSGSNLHFYSLTKPGREAQRSLHQAEVEFWQKYPDAPVRFHVSADRDGLEEQFDWIEPALAKT